MIISRFVLIVLLLGTIGCSSVTFIQATATDNPLDRVEQQAQEEDWSIERVNADTLHLSHAWVVSSIVNLGYVVSHTNLVYSHADSVLYIQYYLRIYSAVTLFIPQTYDIDYRRSRLNSKWSLSARMNEEINNIMRWSEIPMAMAWYRRSYLSEIFPPPRPLLVTPLPN